MDFKEFDLEQAIWDTYHLENGPEILGDRGLSLFGNMSRQVNIPSYGTIDLLTMDYCPSDRSFDVQCVELKVGTIGYSEIGQIARYMTALKRICQTISTHPPKKWNPPHLRTTVNGILVGSKVSLDGDSCFLIEHIMRLSVYTYNLDITKGITFSDQSGYFNKGEQFEAMQSNIRKRILSEHREWYAQEMLLQKVTDVLGGGDAIP